MARVWIGFKAWPQDVDWATLDATCAAGGELDVFDAAWGNDHLTTPFAIRATQDQAPNFYEPLITYASLANFSAS